MRRWGVAGLSAVVVFGLLLVGIGPAGARAAPEPDVTPYRGLGAWVDTFDYAPRLQQNGSPPPVTPAAVDDMARLGVRTLYLQVSNPDGASPDQITDAAEIGEFVTRAKSVGLKVVGWYLPGLADVGVDTRMLTSIAGFRSGSARFDTVALDLEYTEGEADVSTRNDNAVQLAANARTLLGPRRAIGAVVYPAVQTEVLNPILWPNFPYKRLAKSVDVWMPMAYYTFRSAPYRDPFRYVDESVTRLRKDLDDTNALVHPIGGIADQTSPADYVAFMRAVTKVSGIGWSVYDYNTTTSSAWTFLRREGGSA
jgi:hypothetical protein